MGEILLCIDTFQAEVVIVDEVDEKASCRDSDTGKIDDDIFNCLNKKGTFRLYILGLSFIIIPSLWAHKIARRKPR